LSLTLSQFYTELAWYKSQFVLGLPFPVPAPRRGLGACADPHALANPEQRMPISRRWGL